MIDNEVVYKLAARASGDKFEARIENTLAIMQEVEKSVRNFAHEGEGVTNVQNKNVARGR